MSTCRTPTMRAKRRRHHELHRPDDGARPGGLSAGQGKFVDGRATFHPITIRENVMGAYAQGHLENTPRLTLNYGMRWEPYLPWSSKYGLVQPFDKNLFDQNVRSTVFVKSPVGMVYPATLNISAVINECNRWSTNFFRASDWRGIQEATDACPCEPGMGPL